MNFHLCAIQVMDTHTSTNAPKKAWNTRSLGTWNVLSKIRTTLSNLEYADTLILGYQSSYTMLSEQNITK